MANKVFDYYKELPSWAKGIVVVGALGVIYIFASQTLKRIKQQAEDRKNQQSVLDAKSDMSELAKKGIKPTISKSQADGWVAQIVAQFKNADLLLQSGDLTKRIFSSLKNDADFLLLKVSFGIKTYPDALWGEVKNVSLEGAIQDELTNGTISELNKILSTKGITYRV
jgi:type II secretory pathway pseudopilin PulG